MNESTEARAVSSAAVGSRRKAPRRAALVVFVVALLGRLALLPIATLDSGDVANRSWLGWFWADDPSLITHGVWGPLHFYLIGALMRF